MHLCALKRTAELSKEQLRAWYAGLQTFPAWIVNSAVLSLVLTKERFPEFGDLYQECYRLADHAGLIKRDYIPTGNGERTISKKEIDTIGAALGLVTTGPQRPPQTPK